MTERERAERFAGWVRSTNPTEAQIIEQYMIYAREERARAWEEARGLLLAQQCHEPFYGSAIYKQVVVDFARWIDKLVDMCEERAKQLRKEEHGTTR